MWRAEWWVVLGLLDTLGLGLLDTCGLVQQNFMRRPFALGVLLRCWVDLVFHVRFVITLSMFHTRLAALPLPPEDGSGGSWGSSHHFSFFTVFIGFADD